MKKWALAFVAIAAFYCTPVSSMRTLRNKALEWARSGLRSYEEHKKKFDTYLRQVETGNLSKENDLLEAAKAITAMMDGESYLGATIKDQWCGVRPGPCEWPKKVATEAIKKAKREKRWTVVAIRVLGHQWQKIKRVGVRAGKTLKKEWQDFEPMRQGLRLLMFQRWQKAKAFYRQQKERLGQVFEQAKGRLAEKVAGLRGPSAATLDLQKKREREEEFSNLGSKLGKALSFMILASDTERLEAAYDVALKYAGLSEKKFSAELARMNKAWLIRPGDYIKALHGLLRILIRLEKDEYDRLKQSAYESQEKNYQTIELNFARLKKEWEETSELSALEVRFIKVKDLGRAVLMVYQLEQGRYDSLENKYRDIQTLIEHMKKYKNASHEAVSKRANAVYLYQRRKKIESEKGIFERVTSWWFGQ